MSSEYNISRFSTDLMNFNTKLHELSVNKNLLNNELLNEINQFIKQRGSVVTNQSNHEIQAQLGSLVTKLSVFEEFNPIKINKLVAVIQACSLSIFIPKSLDLHWLQYLSIQDLKSVGVVNKKYAALSDQELIKRINKKHPLTDILIQFGFNPDFESVKQKLKKIGPELTYLNCEDFTSGEEFTPWNQKQILELISYCPNLTVLELHKCGITAEGVTSLISSTHLSKVVSLNLRNNPIGSYGIRSIFASKSLPMLTKLNLDEIKFEAEDFQIITSSELLGRLKEVYLGDKTNDLQNFCESISLKQLDLKIWCRVGRVLIRM